MKKYARSERRPALEVVFGIWRWIAGAHVLPLPVDHPDPRQTPLCWGDKAVIRRASVVHPRLGNQQSADGIGDAPYNVPDPVEFERHRGRPTTRDRSWWFLNGPR